MMETAIRQRWKISEEKRTEVVDKIFEVITKPGVDERTVVAAARVFAALEAQNQADEVRQSGIDQLRQQLIAIAQARGIAITPDRIGDTPGQ